MTTREDSDPTSRAERQHEEELERLTFGASNQASTQHHGGSELPQSSWSGAAADADTEDQSLESEPFDADLDRWAGDSAIGSSAQSIVWVSPFLRTLLSNE
jgi:hypothetical protein